MASRSPACLFEDRFVVSSVDSSKFERVSRIRGRSTGFDAEIILDVNTELFGVTERESIYIGISNSVTSGSKIDDYAWEKEHTLMDQYDYVMYGKIFKMEEKSSERRTVYASFGGLMLALSADKQVLGELELDMRVYILVRRAEEMLAN